MRDFQFNGVCITSLAHEKCLFKIILGHNYFITGPIFKLFEALFTTFGLQKDAMVIFFMRFFRKVRFLKMQFLKDGDWTVGYIYGQIRKTSSNIHIAYVKASKFRNKFTKYRAKNQFQLVQQEIIKGAFRLVTLLKHIMKDKLN